MNRERLYLSTIASDAVQCAKEYGLGLEIAEYCTAWNLDEQLDETYALVSEKLAGISKCVFHGPFNELFPCAIDPRARELAAYRFRQAIRQAKCYDAQKIIFHGGYNERLYYPCWYTEQSVTFWRAFLQDDPDIEIVLENVLETEPEMMLDIVRQVDSPRLRLCLDIGHVNAYSNNSAEQWIKICAPYLSHFHIHNNDGKKDSHSALNCGTLPVRAILELSETLCPQASFTLELMQAEPSVQWMAKNGLLT